MDRTKQHYQFLDHIRGIAILIVFICHSLGASFGYGHLPWGDWHQYFASKETLLTLLPGSFASAGVAIFFVVSGFCIHLSYLRSKTKNWKDFYIRRFFRIYPPYLFALLLFALIFPTTRLALQSGKDWMQFISHLLLLHNFHSEYVFGINPAFWSIAVEVQLYMVYPLLILLTNRFGWKRTLVTLCIGELLMRAAASIYAVVNHTNTPLIVMAGPFYYWGSWTLGAALAEAASKGGELPFRRMQPGLLFGVASVASLIKPLTTFSFFLFALYSAALVAKLIESEKPLVKRAIPSAFLNSVGIWSYSIYLLHQPILESLPKTLRDRGIDLHHILLFGLCLSTLAVILPLSWLYFKYIEMPCNSLGKLFLKRPATPATANKV